MRARSFLLLAVLLAACGAPQGAPSAPSSSSAGNTAPAPATRTTVQIAYGAEVKSLASKLANGVWAPDVVVMINAPLTIKTPRGEAVPRLAAEVPSRDNGSWVVNPDGTMRTTWKIKQNARWHDGRPITPNDFVFAHRLALDERMPVDDRRPEQFMERIEPVDDHTFVIHWKELYPAAGELGSTQLEPLPEHILAPMYESSSIDTFLAQSFWTSPDYVGAGPYRLARWDPGAQMVFRANDDYVLGRPKIDEVILRIIPDPNAVVANLLSGEVQVSVNIALGQQAGATVREQWARSGDGTVLPIPTRFRFMDIQQKPGDVGQPALLDVRVRRALSHGLDRATLTEIATAGLADLTDVFLPPSDAFYDTASRAVAKYPYDMNRALALLQEAGWTKRGDNLVDSSGQVFTLDVFSSEGPDNETEQAIIAADYRKLGMNVSETVYPRSRQNDREFRSKFAGLNPTALTIEIPETMIAALGEACPRAPRFAGNNRGCWSNPEFDRLYLVASTSLDRNERGNAIVQALRILSEDVGKMPLSYRTDVLAFRKGLTGPGLRWPGLGDAWNIHEWQLG
jgi:peptide/nickel transport system substrate-binding protein